MEAPTFVEKFGAFFESFGCSESSVQRVEHDRGQVVVVTMSMSTNNPTKPSPKENQILKQQIGNLDTTVKGKEFPQTQDNNTSVEFGGRISNDPFDI